MKKLNPKLITAISVLAVFGMATPNSAFAQNDSSKTGYVSINGLEMYYEIYSSDHDGVPLVLLHGAFVNLVEPVVSMDRKLSGSRKVISFAMQGHGRTADINRPLSITQMAILPVTTHIGVMMQRLDWFIPMIERLLKQPMPKKNNNIQLTKDLSGFAKPGSFHS